MAWIASSSVASTFRLFGHVSQQVLLFGKKLHFSTCREMFQQVTFQLFRHFLQQVVVFGKIACSTFRAGVHTISPCEERQPRQGLYAHQGFDRSKRFKKQNSLLNAVAVSLRGPSTAASMTASHNARRSAGLQKALGMSCKAWLG